MQSINQVILSSSFMPLFFGTTIACVALALWGLMRWGQPGAAALVAGGLLYALGMFVCTAAFNVPLNEALDRVEPGAAEAALLWSQYLVVWTRWNHLRGLCSLVACGLLLWAAGGLR